MRNEISKLYEENSVLAYDHQRNDGIGPGKKTPGVQNREEDSNSAESDSPSSNFVSVQGSNTVARYDDESSGDKESDAGSDDVSLAADSIGTDEGSKDQDPLPIKELQFALEELEREVQKWRNVGKDDLLISNDPMQEVLELKDAKILELELALNSRGVKTELEDYLMKIVQADVEHVVITTTTKRLTEGPLREIKHNIQQNIASSQDTQATKKQDGNLETKESSKILQNRVCRYTSCLIIQFILLLVTLYLKLSPQNVEVVPT